ncbi:MAG TPA: hypothetical protein VIM69_03655, partial [Opitutaceae bacterium]
AYFVSRAWAHTFDANSHRFYLGDTLALLAESNRVLAWQGIYPENGVPLFAYDNFGFTIRPHSRSQLRLKLTPSAKTASTNRWKITCQSAGAPPFVTEVSGEAPWVFAIPLTPNVDNQIEISAASPAGMHGVIPPYEVKSVSIESIP